MSQGGLVSAERWLCLSPSALYIGRAQGISRRQGGDKGTRHPVHCTQVILTTGVLSHCSGVTPLYSRHICGTIAMMPCHLVFVSFPLGQQASVPGMSRRRPCTG